MTFAPLNDESAHKAGPRNPILEVGRGWDLEAAVAGFVEGLDLDERDSRVLTGMVAVRLARAMDRHTSAAAAKELRGCLDRLTPDDEGDRREDTAQTAELLEGLREVLR